MLTEVEITARLNDVAAMVAIGNRDKAATECREILKHFPHSVPTLVWLGFCTSDLNEAYEATARAYQLDPRNPDVVQAINAYNSRQAQAVSAAGSSALVEAPQESLLPPLPPTEFISLTAPAPTPGNAEKRQFRPVGEPIRDHHSKNPLIRFVMSESGGLFLVAVGLFFSSILFLFLNFLGLFSDRYNTAGEIWMIIRAGFAIALIFGSGLWIFTLGQDYIMPPIKEYGAISNRRAERQEVKDNGRSVGVEFYYTAEFTPQGTPPGVPPVLLRMNQAQYEASGKTRWAYVEYRAKSGFVSLFQSVQ